MLEVIVAPRSVMPLIPLKALARYRYEVFVRSLASSLSDLS